MRWVYTYTVNTYFDFNPPPPLPPFFSSGHPPFFQGSGGLDGLSLEDSEPTNKSANRKLQFLSLARDSIHIIYSVFLAEKFSSINHSSSKGERKRVRESERVPFTQKLIPQNLWPYPTFFCGVPYEKKIILTHSNFGDTQYKIFFLL